MSVSWILKENETFHIFNFYILISDQSLWNSLQTNQKIKIYFTYNCVKSLQGENALSGMEVSLLIDKSLKMKLIKMRLKKK